MERHCCRLSPLLSEPGTGRSSWSIRPHVTLRQLRDQIAVSVPARGLSQRKARHVQNASRSPQQGAHVLHRTLRLRLTSASPANPALTSSGLMSARQASQSSSTSSVAAPTAPTTRSSTRSRRDLRPRRSPPPSAVQNSETTGTPSSPKDAGPSQPMPSAMSLQSRRGGLSPTVASTTSASSVGGRLREDPLLDLLIEQQKKSLREVNPLEGGSSDEVEQAARLFLETSRLCFQTSMDAMELDEAEMESDYRSQERDNVMSTWTDMLCEPPDL